MIGLGLTYQRMETLLLRDATIRDDDQQLEVLVLLRGVRSRRLKDRGRGLEQLAEVGVLLVERKVANHRRASLARERLVERMHQRHVVAKLDDRQLSDLETRHRLGDQGHGLACQLTRLVVRHTLRVIDRHHHTIVALLRLGAS